MNYLSIENCVGNTPLITLRHLNPNLTNTLLLKLEGNNPAGSVKDRAALMMICEAEKRAEISPGDTLIEATSGNTGIALAMICAIKGYQMVLIMPDNLSQERADAMRAYGAKLIFVTKNEGMEGARDLALKMSAEGVGKILNQFANTDNPLAHFNHTAPEIWRATGGSITHFVSSMGTTGTIVGCSHFFKKKNPKIKIIGVEPEEGAQIPGIRRWAKAYLPKIFDAKAVDEVMAVGQKKAEDTTRMLAQKEGILSGISSGGALACALELSAKIEHATIVTIACDRGDRYLSTGVFS